MDSRNMKVAVAAALAASIVWGIFAFKAPKQDKKVSYMEVTTIESIVPGGLGRSRMLITNSDGKQEEMDMKNFYSLAGINFGNIMNNDREIVTKLNQLAAQGWQVMEVSSGAQSPSQGFEQGIYLTRYTLKKEE